MKDRLTFSAISDEFSTSVFPAENSAAEQRLRGIRLFRRGNSSDSGGSDDNEPQHDGYWWGTSAYCAGTGITVTDGCGLNLSQNGVQNMREPAVRANGPKDAVEKLKKEYGGEQCSVCKHKLRDCIVDAWPRSDR